MEGFKDLEVFKLSRDLVREIYSLTQQEQFKRDYSLVYQKGTLIL